MSVAVYFETEKYMHLIPVDKEDQLEDCIYMELQHHFSSPPTKFNIIGKVFVVPSEDPLVESERLQEKVMGIINKFKGENESV
jgi:tRNA G37 N-methylase Trm5